MDFKARSFDPASFKTDCMVVLLPASGNLSDMAAALNRASGGLIATILKSGELAKSGSSVSLYAPTGLQAKKLVLVSTGDKTPTDSQFAKLTGKIASLITASGTKSAAVCLNGVCPDNRDLVWTAQQLARAAGESLYLFDQCKSKQEQNRPALAKTALLSDSKDTALLNAAIDKGLAVAKGMNYARELGDLPANICTPTYLADRARELATATPKLTTKILSEKQMEQLKMGSLLSVTAGTDIPAHLIIMEYKGGTRGAAPVALVGKGVTFDSGGISIKPGAGMDEMKYDMCGAASVFGALVTAAELKLPINIVGLIPAVENMPSGKATKPGDIVTSMSGQTIEILNTDAEGRLILCDALTYAERYKPRAVVDIATLTGACVVALGSHASGLFSNNDDLATDLLTCGEETGDRAWRLPIWDDYDQQLKSNFADMANIGSKGAGSVVAACFLGRFAKKYPWAHLDIAGTAWNSGGQKGATGRPVPLLVEYLCRQAG
ncbi:MAG: cytosol aminopeptidase [Gammaproteobacteria bacterium BRH_c0]|nr:MAG: cytosol aminopeptidase [Gammaproteobacteria bacterium BRH_c0]